MTHDHRKPVVHLVHSLEGGGTERTLVSLLRAFDPTRLRHVVVTLRSAGALAAQLPDHVACHALTVSGRSRWTGLRVARIVPRGRPAVIHARNTGCWFDAILARLWCRRARLVLGFHGLETAEPFSRRQRCLARWALAVGARFTSVSEAGRRQLREQANVPADRIQLLRNGVPMDAFEALGESIRSRTRAALQLDDTAFVVGIVGSLTPVKQHAGVIRAIAAAVEHVPHIALVIIGDGPLRALLEQQVRDEGIADRVRFAGRRDDVPALLAGLDAYVCNSASEGMNNALLEAMAAGLPVIATDVGDNALIVRNGTEGWIVGPDHPARIAALLTKLASAPGVRRQLGEAAKRRAREFDFSRTVRAYEAYYDSALARGADPTYQKG